MELEKQEDYQSYIDNNERILVEFFASWCPPCKMQLPILEEFIENNPNIPVLFINVDVVKGFHRNFNISNVPTFLMYKNGEIVGRADDYIEYEEIEELVKKAD